MFAVTKNNVVIEYPIFIGDIALRHPSVGIPVVWDGGDVEDVHYERVHLTPAPNTSFLTQTVMEGTPVFKDGVLCQTWKIVPATAEQIAERTAARSAEMRSRRDRMLADTDWVVIKALETGSDVDPAWKTYRQALRDLPESHGFPVVDFPKPPTT
jgi:hypothetical protein